MYAFILKRFLFITFFFAAISANAQESHFLYLQTENGQPFYVKLNNKLTSSSSAGYLILPKLSDGNYELVVGFPKNQAPEESYNISINKNTGFLIKNFGERGWGLFDMQSLAILPGNNSPEALVQNEVQAEPLKTDAFSNMLANVVKDSSILRNPQPVRSPEEIKNAEKSLSATEAQKIERIMSEKDADGTQLVYVDNTNGNADTVRVFVPATNSKEATAIEQPAEKSQPTSEITAEVESKQINENKPTEKGFNVEKVKSQGDTVRFTITPTTVDPDSEIITQEKDTIKIYKERSESTNSEKKKPAESENRNPFITVIEPKEDKVDKSVEEKDTKLVVLPKVVTSSSVNSDCKNFATNSDFLTLRKKMASDNGPEEMIESAKKVFRSKCFSTEQIRNLSYLFLKDEGKYMFFDSAYPYASDSDQYYMLVSQLKDDYYINRFNAMIHK